MNQQSLMKKVRQMQQEMTAAQQEIEQAEFKTNCGPVTIVMFGSKELKSVSIDPSFEVTSKEDLEMLGDMVVAANHQAIQEIDKYTNEKMAKYQAFLGGMGSLF